MIAYLLVGLAALATLGGIYWRVDHNGYERGKGEIQAEWSKANEDARKREKDASDKAAAELAAERAKRKVVVQERTVYVDKIVDRPVYRNVCLDADGMSCINAAIAGKDAAGCKPDAGVPAPKPAN